MNYINKIILCFTEDNIIGYQYEDRIVSENGDSFKTQKDFIDVYTRREVYNKKMAYLRKNGIFKENKKE
tara:strand:- start:1050 stop:1256 length:207 start_codon:yes stop_codon:yes gene_type:complete